MNKAAEHKTLATWTLTKVTDENPVFVEIDYLVSCGPSSLRCEVVVESKNPENDKQFLRTKGYKLTHAVKGSSIDVDFYVASRKDLISLLEWLLSKDFPKILTRPKKAFQVFPPKSKVQPVVIHKED